MKSNLKLFLIAVAIVAMSSPVVASPADSLMESVTESVERGEVNQLRQWLNIAMEEGGRPDLTVQQLLHSCDAGNIDAIKLLLDAGVDPNFRNSNGWSAFLVACTYPRSVTVMKYLIDHGADVNIRTNDSSTALHIYAMFGDEHGMKLLLNAGVNPQLRNLAKQTPLHIAAQYGNARVIPALLSSGAYVHAKDSSGFSPIRYIWQARGKSSGGYRMYNPGPYWQPRDHNWGGYEAYKLLVTAGGSPLEMDWHGSAPALRVAEYDDLKLLSFAIAHGAEPISADDGGCTPLHIAAKFDCIRVAEKLIELGAEIETEDQDGYTPLIYAAIYNSPKVAWLLLERGADPSMQGTPRRPQSRIAGHFIPHHAPIQWAGIHGNTDVLRVLIQFGADFLSPMADGKSLLHHTAERGHYEASKVLIEAGADVNRLDAAGQTPFDMALKARSRELVNYMIASGAIVDRPIFDSFDEPLSHSSLTSAACTDDTLILHAVISADAKLDRTDHLGNTALQYAVDGGHLATARYLIEHGASISIANCKGSTVLHTAARDNHVELIELLLQHGADINVRDVNESTPLHYAASKLSVEAEKTLLIAGADPEPIDKFGKSPIDILVDAVNPYPAEQPDSAEWVVVMRFVSNLDSCKLTFRNRPHDTSEIWHMICHGVYPIVRWMLDHGADPNETDSLGNTLWHLVVISQNDLVPAAQILFDYHADPTRRNRDGFTPLGIAMSMRCALHPDIARLALSAGADASEVLASGEPLILVASRNDQRNCILFLLEHGADPNVIGQDGLTPLLEFCSGRDTTVVRQLIEHGAQVNRSLPALQGQSVLHLSARFSYFDVVKMLLAAGADPNQRDPEGNTPLHHSAMAPSYARECCWAIDALMKAGANPRVKNKQGQTPAQLARQKGMQEVADYLDKITSE